MTTDFDTIVIGGGIIGAAVLFRESQRNKRILLIEKGNVGGGASYGNATMIAVSEVLPMATGDTILSAPKMLLHPGGSLAIDPLYFPKLIPWFLKFKRASAKSNVEQTAQLLAKLCGRATQDTHDLLSQAKANHLINSREFVRVYDTSEDYDKSLDDWRKRGQLGVKYSFVDGIKLQKMLPFQGTTDKVGVKVEGYHSLDSPQNAAIALVDAATENGAQMLTATVSKLEASAEIATVTTQDGQELTTKQVVIAAGAHSHLLAKCVGDKVPLETERGYHVQFANPGISIDRTFAFTQHGLAVAQVGNELRFSGYVEYAGLKKPPAWYTTHGQTRSILGLESDRFGQVRRQA